MVTPGPYGERVWTTIPSPLGEVLLEASGGVLVRAGFAPFELPDGEPAPDDPVLAQAARELGEYFAGTRRSFTVPVGPPGTPFQQAVWAELQRIPAGETRTYAELAARLGSPGAVRAVGSANGRNPVAVLVPCHRVIGSDGNLRGYAGGVERKLALLALERQPADDALF
ncbi:MAG: cysteine methyltransferase [Frankiales bacterium]|nr:cysteine methyltransferase [Frankiales bacterium]